VRLITANLARSVIGHRPSHLISAGDLAAINQRCRGPLWRCQSGPFTQRHQHFWDRNQFFRNETEEHKTGISPSSNRPIPAR